jgi:hypothetical protein
MTHLGGGHSNLSHIHFRAASIKKANHQCFEPMYLDVLNDEMVGFANISARDMLNHLFTTYGNISAVDLENNFEHMRRAWDPQQPVASSGLKIVSITLRQGVSSHSKSTLDVQKYLQLCTS